MPRTLFLTALLCTLIGCKSKPQVELINATDRTLDAQIALPWPAYRAFESAGHFEITFPPGGSWSTAHATQRDRVKLPLRMPNGVTLLRVKPEGSLVHDYSVFTLVGASHIRATVLEDASGEFEVWITADDESPQRAERPSAEFFE